MGEGFAITRGDDALLHLEGAFTLARIAEIDAELAAATAAVQDGAPSEAAPAPRGIDGSGVASLDTAGAWAVLRALGRAGLGLEAARGFSPEQTRLLRTVADAMPRPVPAAPARSRLAETLERLGRAAEEIARLLRDLTAYLGLFALRLGAAVARPRRLPVTALVHHCQQVGLNAVPIVVLMAFLIGVVLAFQGATQLRRFGADVFVVDLIAISVLRELGVLLTAIIVAGRTASAFTAQLGAMKMREEIDAMRTLAIDPAEALILPRVLALVITLPVLTLLANVAGLAGGALMAWIDLGISPAMFRTRLLETSVDHVTVGMLKAPVFAVVIGLIGCHAGMQVQGSTDSLGRLTSASVVRAIFAVILIDALFSIFYSEVGL